MSFLKFRQGDKLEYLKWWDILILTIIMFSYFIYSSFSSFFVLPDPNTAELPQFGSSVNWDALIFQLILLGIALIYLYLRNFDFTRWRIRVNVKSVLIGIALFVGVALVMDVYFTLVYYVIPYPSTDTSVYYDYGYEVSNLHPFLAKLAEIDISLLLYSALNGFYEEIFFLGMCLSVPENRKLHYFLYSLVIRYSFHTYQGNISAVGITLFVGIIYYLVYRKMKEENLFPFFLGHAISDVLGLGIISYFF